MPEFLIEFLKRDPGGPAFEMAQLASFARIEEAARKAAAAMGGGGPGSGGRGGGADRAADAAARAAARAAAAEQKRVEQGMVGLASLQVQAAKVARRVEQEAEQAADKAARAEQRRVEQGMVGLDQLRGSGLKLQQRLETAEERRAARFKKLLSEEEVAARVHNQRIANANEARTAAAMKAAGVEQRGFHDGSAAADRLIGSVSSLALSYVSVQSATRFMADLAANVNKAAEHQKQLADEFIRYRDAQREQQSMQGGAANNRAALDAARFEAQTGLNQAEGKAFTEAFLGSGAQFVGKTMSESEGEQLRRFAGRYAAATGIDAGVIGDLAGKTSGFHDYRPLGDQAAEAAMGEFGLDMSILQRGSGGNAVLAAQNAKITSRFLSDDAMKGVFRDSAEAAVAQSVVAEAAPEESETAVRNAIKALRSFDNENFGPVLKKAGISPETGMIQAIKQLGPVLEAEARKRGAGVTVQDVLRTKDYHLDEREANALAVFVNKGLGSGIIADREKMVAEYRAGAGTAQMNAAGRVMGDLDKLLKDPTGAAAQRLAEAGNREADVEKGSQTAMYATLRQVAEGNLKRSGDIDSLGAGLSETFWNKLNLGHQLGMGIDERTRNVEAEMTRILEEQAKKAGINMPEGGYGAMLHHLGGAVPGIPDALGFQSPELRMRALNSMAGQLSAAGIDPYGLNGGDRGVAEMKDAAAALQAAAAALQAAAGPPRGSRPPARNPTPPPQPPPKAPPGGLGR